MDWFLTIWFACAPMYGISDTKKVLLFWLWSPFQNEFQCVWKLFITILILDNIWHFGFLLRHVICFCCVNILRKFGTSQVKAQFYVRNSRTVSAVSQVGAEGVCGLPDLFIYKYERHYLNIYTRGVENWKNIYMRSKAKLQPWFCRKVSPPTYLSI